MPPTCQAPASHRRRVCRKRTTSLIHHADNQLPAIRPQQVRHPHQALLCPLRLLPRPQSLPRARHEPWHAKPVRTLRHALRPQERRQGRRQRKALRLYAMASLPPQPPARRGRHRIPARTVHRRARHNLRNISRQSAVGAKLVKKSPCFMVFKK